MLIAVVSSLFPSSSYLLAPISMVHEHNLGCVCVQYRIRHYLFIDDFLKHRKNRLKINPYAVDKF